MTVATLLVFVNLSCEKEDVITPVGLQDKDIVGDWDFYSLDWNEVNVDFNWSTINGVDETLITYGCIPNLKWRYLLTKIYFKNVKIVDGKGKIELYTDCIEETDEYSWVMNYQISNNTIILGDYLGDAFDAINIKFLILNTDTFNGTELILKIVNGDSNIPNNGVYTLRKR